MIDTTNIENCTQRLMDALDDEIQQLELNLSRLDQLRRLIVKQDHDALNGLLNTIRSEAGTFRSYDQRRLSLCKQLATIINCDPAQMNLSRLHNYVSQEMQSAIRLRKNTLQFLSARLQKELAATQMLLTDCARFNRMLLNAIFNNRAAETLTYNPSGLTKRQTETMLMNVQF